MVSTKFGVLLFAVALVVGPSNASVAASHIEETAPLNSDAAYVHSALNDGEGKRGVRHLRDGTDMNRDIHPQRALDLPTTEERGFMSYLIGTKKVPKPKFPSGISIKKVGGWKFG
ncbi:hypothetical protein PsorP6_005474 [Peronosclerospora sorghi]|uniref:Uncharacterized protein n=1 Tax=Peronosclerospora sorghi TaxID=230839 RepID=A0ACC0W2R5_9STRA|nr:hypothetical protein PsorP6_005474 [Peronosclerospora sorghi]